MREAFEHLSQACKNVSCLSFLYVPQCFAAGVRWRSSGQSVATGPRIRQLACSRARRCQFTHGWRERNFLSLLKDKSANILWSLWCGQEMTWRVHIPTPTQAIEDVMAFGSRYGVPIRLVDVVGERYQWRWFSFASNSIYRWTSKKIIKKIPRCSEVKSGIFINIFICLLKAFPVHTTATRGFWGESNQRTEYSHLLNIKPFMAKEQQEITSIVLISSKDFDSPPEHFIHCCCGRKIGEATIEDHDYFFTCPLST